MWNSGSSRSPPPLQHPIPTHPHYIPEPPDTPVSIAGSEPQGYMRFSSESSRPPLDSFAQPAQLQNPYGQTSGIQQHPGGAGTGYRAANQNQYGAYPQPPNVYGAAPGFGGVPWGVNDATAQIGMQLGRNAVQAGQEYVEKNFGSYMLPKRMLKSHFNVSNSYVLLKLKLLLFPWRHKGWKRREIQGSDQDASGSSGAGVKYAPPREDVNSPDLYIPTMALVTYILLSALRAGLDSKFHPEVLAAKMSKAITIIVLECVFIKLGCYTLAVEGKSQLPDIIAYVGYKFVASTVLLVLSIIGFRASLYWGIFLYLFCANGFFLLRSLRALVLPSNSSASASRQHDSQRNYRLMFLFSVAALQVPGMWFLS
ncbi:Protein transport protein yif1 AltName: Full=Heavy metal resistance factor 1; AltName: Full=YIP1-interacting factor 1 [Serendipita indica DSM 11827]|uniref:Protein YIF1 n=1 Tax=Serendipita indica (strain DSM 11827) TaxID=1109443 RepID=G4TT22_SERID|nr:Protein transport protein yif1 AltName: Full=Heavy metal resistance factor 1; AltName: Full=YIP1-interacting factor 1 [Serendipita indica DSM 11827]CCA74465.1 related to Slh1p interacting factor [Serendipita indica DSM 11827]